MGRIPAAFLVCVAIVLVAGCGGDGPEDPGDTTAPEVTGSSPEPGTEDVGLLAPLELEFSEAMDPETLDGESIWIEGRGAGLHLLYDDVEQRLRILPESLLAAGSPLRLRVEGAADLAGNALEGYALDFATGPFDCDHLADRFEPNDEIAAATPVELDTLIPSLSTCGEDVDVYRFTLEEEAMVTARTLVTHEENDPGAEWEHTSWAIHWYYDEGMNLTTLGAWAVTGQETSFRYSFLPGTYYVKLFGHYDEVDVIYDLFLETGPACDDDVYEDNDFPEFAAALEPGAHALRGCYLDADCYVLDVLAGQTFQFRMDAPDAVGFRYLKVWEPGGGSYDSGSVADDPLAGQLEIGADGEAAIRIQFWSDDVDYELTLELLD